MNLLGLEINRNVCLRPRHEGKLKSYESCSDLRAWSHDSRARDTYLREWIKRDMPICVLSCAALANFLRTMTCRSRAKTAPRCHPDCKSKVLLESICTSCHAIKECLKDEPSFDKYFAEQEFETIHWPCDKCLDVLKSIKMFWKIIIERIFGINIPKEENFDNIQDSRTNTVKSVAKLWEKEVVQQTLFFKNVTPWLRRGPDTKTESPCKQPFPKREIPTRIPRPCRTDNKDSFSLKITKMKIPSNSALSQKVRASDMGRSTSSTHRSFEKTSRKLHRCTSVRVRMVDAACETCNLGKESEELKSYKKNVEVLQLKCNTQDSEIEKLRRENNSLKIELQNFYKTCSWKSAISSSPSSNYDKTALVPKPFECCIEEGEAPTVVKNTDSEMIITMKNCRNESFRQVSLLQVLHKTNTPIIEVEQVNAPCSKKENPIELLTKVQTTFGEIVRREIKLVNNKRFSTKHTDIDATFSKLRNTQSAPSCSTICSETASSESNFVGDWIND